jgi:hypothetical protein
VRASCGSSPAADLGLKGGGHEPEEALVTLGGAQVLRVVTELTQPALHLARQVRLCLQCSAMQHARTAYMLQQHVHVHVHAQRARQ